MAKKVDLAELKNVSGELNTSGNIERKVTLNKPSTCLMDESSNRKIEFIRVFTKEKKQDILYRYILEGIEKDKQKFNVPDFE